MSVECFLLEPTDKSRRFLRRYAMSAISAGGKCETCSGGYHSARVLIGDFKSMVDDKGFESSPNAREYAKSRRWPKQAECGYKFTDDDARQVFVEHIYKRFDTSELMTLREAPPGAMWEAWWMGERWQGPDGKSICVRCPGDCDWIIDSQARNCDSKCVKCARPYNAHEHDKAICDGYEDSAPEHRCWIRHGTPPMLTVDKNGNTCGAGAGSIQTSNWHGFLTNGVLSESR